jgi:Zn-dependent peptidase ImmA (M78 family)/DNA-binding XRE family transcriptional regulator
MHVNQAALGKRLREARENCGFTQEAVAQELGIPRTAVVHIEGGDRVVTTVQLGEFARLYQRPVAEFFRERMSSDEEDVLTALGRISSEFRDDPQVKQAIEKHVHLCQHGSSLRRLLELDALAAPPEYPMSPPGSIWDSVQQGQAVASEERRRLALGDNPIPDMADLITAAGIWASGTHLPNEMSGMFLRHSSMGMVILVNFKDTRSRKRFSYAHEYAHGLMDRSIPMTVSRFSDRDQLTEVRANAFAAEFLMPAAGVQAFLAHRNKGIGSRESIPVYDAATDQLGETVQALHRSAPGANHINFQLVARLANHFGVSYPAACYRLRSLKCVKDSEFNDLISKQEQAHRFLDILRMNNDGEPEKCERQTKPDRELTSELITLAVEAHNRNLISKAKLMELGSLMGISRSDMAELAAA